MAMKTNWSELIEALTDEWEALVIVATDLVDVIERTIAIVRTVIGLLRPR